MSMDTKRNRIMNRSWNRNKKGIEIGLGMGIGIKGGIGIVTEEEQEMD